MAPMIVTAGLIVKGGRILLAQRHKDKHQGLKWEFHGGKLEDGESPEECLSRELEEELGVKARVSDIYTAVFYRYPDFDILLLVYLAEILSGDPQPVGCRQIQWVAPEEMAGLEIPPADTPIKQKILAEGLES